MDPKDLLGIIHPFLAVAFVFPMVGIVVNMAWQTRQRRLQLESGEKSKIPPIVGREHVKIGQWLAGSVVGITLIALAYAITFLPDPKLYEQPPLQIVFILFMFAATIASVYFLYQARELTWRVVFSVLSTVGLVILGAQDGVYRRTDEWYISHFYFGIAVAILMVFSVAILPEIYRDKRWRIAHLVLNTLAGLLFVAQGFTGARDLLEIPLYWQKQYIYKCDWEERTCPFELQSSQPQIENLLGLEARNHPNFQN